MYHTFDSVKEFHVEISSRCNAACPMCSRNELGGTTKPGLKLEDWKKEFIPKVFDSRFKNLRNVLFCSTHGDPAVAPQSLDAVEHLKTNFNTTVEFYSNASTRNKDWWYNLGKLLQQNIDNDDYYRRHDIGIFSIDGLEDTNHIYRRQTRWDVIMENAEAFISAGGRARWDFLIFKHNEHQVEEAGNLAIKMGFKQFRLRKTARFNYSPDGPDRWPVYNRTPLGTPQEFAYYLEPPVNEKFYNKEIDKFESLKEKYGSAENYFDAAKISCLYKDHFNRMYVNAYGQVFPCCFISNDVYPGLNKIRQDTIDKVFNKYGKQFNSLYQHEWQDILNHEWFASKLEESWDTDLEGGKLMRCSRTCGNEYSPIKSQSNTTSLCHDKNTYYYNP
jgi:MoaA/NifB/PqqE/SkfB family radical SAM enzyme